MEPGIWAALGGIIVFYGILIAFGALMWWQMRLLRRTFNEGFEGIHRQFDKIDRQFGETDAQSEGILHRFDRQHDDHMNLVGVVAGLQVEVAELRGQMSTRLDGQAPPAPAPSEK